MVVILFLEINMMNEGLIPHWVLNLRNRINFFNCIVLGVTIKALLNKKNYFETHAHLLSK